jgi:Na+-transporting NADH:ubiquinone oxidoreductase subunit NqrE
MSIPVYVVALAVPPGKRALLLFLVGLIGGFGGARVNARVMRAWPAWRLRSLKHGDVHVHHVVLGVVVMIVAGGLTFALASNTAWRSLLAFFFGAGSGLVLDEFALILHVEDVYWTEAGRKSVDAVVLTAAATLMVLFGFLPFGSDPWWLEGPRWTIAVIEALNLIAVVIASLKGKRLMAAFGVFVPLVAVVGAVTLARPDSPWARRRYAANPAKLQRARCRTVRLDAYRHRWLDLVGGAVDDVPDCRPDGGVESDDSVDVDAVTATLPAPEDPPAAPGAAPKAPSDAPAASVAAEAPSDAPAVAAEAPSDAPTVAAEAPSDAPVASAAAVGAARAAVPDKVDGGRG